MKSFVIFFTNLFIFLLPVFGTDEKLFPLVVITWDYKNATEIAWRTLYEKKGSSLDAIEESCKSCENAQCRGTVGFGGSPDENGETTLDAVLMDGDTMDVGGVGGLRNIKNAISVARVVLEKTEHSMLGGELAADFAVKMGFERESLQTSKSLNMWKNWQSNNCQPNYWKNVDPDPLKKCGPYHLTNFLKQQTIHENGQEIGPENHDTIGVIAIDKKGKIAAGTSTNGKKFKIAGRIGDSPIAGAGAYADSEVGAAAGTGDGDIMMRFLPSFLAVEEMRRGATPSEAATTTVKRIKRHYPKFSGAVIALNKNGAFGAACSNVEGNFPYYVANPVLGEATPMKVTCI